MTLDVTTAKLLATTDSSEWEQVRSLELRFETDHPQGVIRVWRAQFPLDGAHPNNILSHRLVYPDLFLVFIPDDDEQTTVEVYKVLRTASPGAILRTLVLRACAPFHVLHCCAEP
jgi:hypothetical protein